jgi:hypothetical protein
MNWQKADELLPRTFPTAWCSVQSNRLLLIIDGSYLDFGRYYKGTSGGGTWVAENCRGDFNVTHWAEIDTPEGVKLPGRSKIK